MIRIHAALLYSQQIQKPQLCFLFSFLLAAPRSDDGTDVSGWWRTDGNRPLCNIWWSLTSSPRFCLNVTTIQNFKRKSTKQMNQWLVKWRCQLDWIIIQFSDWCCTIWTCCSLLVGMAMNQQFYSHFHVFTSCSWNPDMVRSSTQTSYQSNGVFIFAPNRPDQ